MRFFKIHIICSIKELFLLWGLCILFFSCQQDNFSYDSVEEDNQVVLTYNVFLNDKAQTRAIGNGQSVDQLLVGVFIEDELIDIYDFNRETNGNFLISIPLLRDKEYNLAFWAQKRGNDIYTINRENMQITLDYSMYNKGISLKKTEDFEAFTTVVEGVTVSKALTDGGTLSLIRPFAQVNVAAAEEDILEKVIRAELTLTNLPATFTPLTGKTGTENEAVTFTFTDFDVDENDKLTPSDPDKDGQSYTYLATVWVLPTTTDITVNLYDDVNGENSVREEITFHDIRLDANMRVNIVGNMLQSVWDGKTFSNPALKTEEMLKCPMINWGTRAEISGSILHIETPAELAYILKEGVPEGYTGIHICNHLDMGGHNWGNLLEIGPTELAKQPADLFISALSVNEGEHFTISNIIMDGNNATGLLGDVENLTVNDITFNNITIANGKENDGVGIIAGTSYGNLCMENVCVKGCSLQAASGKGGGMVGFIRRIEETLREESLTATFTGCTVIDSKIEAHYGGKFVGEFSGYDNNEVLNFNNCSTRNIEGIAASDFCNDRKSNFIINSLEEDHFLGREVYCRGTVNFDGKRFVPKWDGTRTVEPLLANATYDTDVTAGNNRFVVYSPFDLAGVRKKTVSPAAIYLRADIDMNGQGVDGEYNVPANFTQSAYLSTDDHYFNPFNYVTTLDGKKSDTENWSIYNMGIQQLEQERAAFILYASGTTTHKNINFHNCQTVAVHKPVETDAKAYGAILVSNVDATYTMENVHAYDCKVFALQKMGTLGARINGTSTLTNNSVNNCYVENYECTISERFDSGTKEMAGFTARVYADFYPHGEVGGMFGFIQGNSTITDCSVNNTIVFGYGQKDKKATVEGGSLVQIGIAVLKYYLVPGRHVGTMIGDIRATGAITITNCIVDSDSKCTNKWDKHQWRVKTGGSSWRPTYTTYTYDYIGQAYYVEFVDSKGSVSVDGTALTLGDCKDGTLYGYQ